MISWGNISRIIQLRKLNHQTYINGVVMAFRNTAETIGSLGKAGRSTLCWMLRALAKFVVIHWSGHRLWSEVCGEPSTWNPDPLPSITAHQSRKTNLMQIEQNLFTVRGTNRWRQFNEVKRCLHCVVRNSFIVCFFFARQSCQNVD